MLSEAFSAQALVVIEFATCSAKFFDPEIALRYLSSLRSVAVPIQLFELLNAVDRDTGSGSVNQYSGSGSVIKSRPTSRSSSPSRQIPELRSLAPVKP